MKTVPTDASVEEFLAGQSDATQTDCRIIEAMYRKATGDEPQMWGSSIVGYGKFIYEEKKKLEWFQGGFSPRKANLTLYAWGGFNRYPELLAKLGKHKTGMGCLYIRKLADVDQKVLRELIEIAMTYRGDNRLE